MAQIGVAEDYAMVDESIFAWLDEYVIVHGQVGMFDAHRALLIRFPSMSITDAYRVLTRWMKSRWERGVVA
jgi:hypothetical protein